MAGVDMPPVGNDAAHCAIAHRSRSVARSLVVETDRPSGAVGPSTRRPRSSATRPGCSLRYGHDEASRCGAGGDRRRISDDSSSKARIPARGRGPGRRARELETATKRPGVRWSTSRTPSREPEESSRTPPNRPAGAPPRHPSARLPRPMPALGRRTSRKIGAEVGRCAARPAGARNHPRRDRPGAPLPVQAAPDRWCRTATVAAIRHTPREPGIVPSELVPRHVRGDPATPTRGLGPRGAIVLRSRAVGPIRAGAPPGSRSGRFATGAVRTPGQPHAPGRASARRSGTATAHRPTPPVRPEELSLQAGANLAHRRPNGQPAERARTKGGADIAGTSSSRGAAAASASRKVRRGSICRRCEATRATSRRSMVGTVYSRTRKSILPASWAVSWGTSATPWPASTMASAVS